MVHDHWLVIDVHAESPSQNFLSDASGTGPLLFCLGFKVKAEVRKKPWSGTCVYRRGKRGGAWPQNYYRRRNL